MASKYKFSITVDFDERAEFCRDTGITEAEADRIAGYIEYHGCLGAYVDGKWSRDESTRHDSWKHLVARSVPPKDVMLVSKLMSRAHGSEPGYGQWLIPIGGIFYNIEGVYMVEGSPQDAPEGPWGWCGQSALFNPHNTATRHYVWNQTANGWREFGFADPTGITRYHIHLDKHGKAPS